MAKVWKSDQKIIGENIKKARKAAKLTQEQFAEESRQWQAEAAATRSFPDTKKVKSRWEFKLSST